MIRKRVNVKESPVNLRMSAPSAWVRGGAFATLLLAFACSSEPKPAESPDAEMLAEPESTESAAPASTSTVQSGIDAIQAGKFDEAAKILGGARAEDPKDAQAAFYHGVALEGVGDVKGAIEAYQAALAIDPKLLEASQNLSFVLIDQGDAEGALAVADAGLEASPDHPGLLTNRATALAMARSPEALPAFEKALEKSPESASLRFNYVEALARSGKRDEAIAESKKIPTDDPAFAAEVSQVLYKLKAFDDCISVLDKSLEKQASADFLVRRGACKDGKKDVAGAQADFEAALKADPKFAPAHFYLGRDLAAAGKKAKAREHLQKAAELGQGTPVGDAAQKKLSELK